MICALLKASPLLSINWGNEIGEREEKEETEGKKGNRERGNAIKLK